MIKEKIKKNNGFVILFAVTLSSIFLAITLGIANIALKEVSFGTGVRDANDAFFAADIGAECALFNDKTDSNSFLPPPDGSGTVQCLGGNIALIGSYPSWSFTISGLGGSDQSCAKVSVVKNGGSPATTAIVAKGYNIGDGNCNSANQNRVERQIEVNY